MKEIVPIDSGFYRASEDQLLETYKKAREVLGSNSGSHLNFILEEHGVEPSDYFVSAGKMAYHKEKILTIRPYPDVQHVVQMINHHGTGTGILSNNERQEKQYDKLHLLGLSDVFNPVVISGELAERYAMPHEAAQKPAPASYHLALERMRDTQGCEDITPEQVLLVDDSLDSIVGANRYGLQTLRVQQGKRGRESLAEAAERTGLDVAAIRPQWELRSISDLYRFLEEHAKLEPTVEIRAYAHARA